MDVVKPYAKIIPLPGRTEFTIEDGINLLKSIEYAARISHRSEDAITVTSYDKLLRSIILNHGDWSVAEHVGVSVEVYADRGITHELVRHRIGAYTMESTRFVNYMKKLGLSVICPDLIFKNHDAYMTWRHVMTVCGDAYYNLIKLGFAPQIVRSLLPISIASKLLISYNLRNWHYFFMARTTKQCHPQMLEITIPLLKEFQSKIPILFDDIQPNGSQSEVFNR